MSKMDSEAELVMFSTSAYLRSLTDEKIKIYVPRVE